MDGLFAIVPIKDPAHGKSRLSRALDDRRRRALNDALARQTVEVCAGCFGPQRTIVATGCRDVIALARSLGVHVAVDPSGETSLDAALRSAAVAATEQGAAGVVVVPADLPLISKERLRKVLVRMPPGRGCLLVPDRRDDGTNLLAMAPVSPGMFAYGKGSLQRHAEQARRLGYRVVLCESDFLGLDLDLPEDLLQLKAAYPRSRRKTGRLTAVMKILGGAATRGRRCPPRSARGRR